MKDNPCFIARFLLSGTSLHASDPTEQSVGISPVGNWCIGQGSPALTHNPIQGLGYLSRAVRPCRVRLSSS
jgi:hypothetical protein